VARRAPALARLWPSVTGPGGLRAQRTAAGRRRRRAAGGDAGLDVRGTRGHRHGFGNPSDEQARVLGLWAPPEPALAFMQDIGAALTPDTPPDPDRMREIYARHASRLLP